MAAFPELYLTWRDIEYRCRVTMDVLTQIEQRVSLQALATDMLVDPLQIKVTHLAWVVFCLLRGAGAPVSADDVWGAMRRGELTEDDVIEVMQFVIVEIFSSAPESVAKKKPPAKKAKSKARAKRKT